MGSIASIRMWVDTVVLVIRPQGVQRGVIRRTINEDSQYIQVKPRMNGTAVSSASKSKKKSIFSVGKFRQVAHPHYYGLLESFRRKKFPQIKMSDWVRSPSNLEKKFRLIYFISFIGEYWWFEPSKTFLLAFNIAYWTYFTLSTRHKSDGEEWKVENVI